MMTDQTKQNVPRNGDAHPTPPGDVEVFRLSIVLKGNRQVTVENLPADPAVGRSLLLDAMFIMESAYRRQGKIVVPNIVVP
jgi:hypothetical protein